jgi:hypothetical protein
MKNDKLKTILTELAEDAAPTREINLWPAMQDQLSTNEWQPQQGNKIMKTPFAQNMFLRRAALALLALVIVFAILLATPQGRAWAQSVLKFFTRAESDTLPAPTAEPLGWVDLTTPGTPLPTITPTPSPTDSAFFVECGDLSAPKCSIEQIRSKVKFTVKELGTIPTGLYFTGATGNADGIYLSYDTVDHSGFISIKESPWTGSSTQTAWQVGASAIVETVDIGGLPGEYVKGSYTMNAGDANAVWNGNLDTQVLHWIDQGVLIEMQIAGPALPLNRDDFVILAESLTTKPVAKLTIPTPEPTEKPWDPHDTWNLSITEAEEQAGFKLILPAKLPEILSLSGALIEAKANYVSVFYLGPNTDGLTLNQQIAPNPKGCILCDFFVGDINKVDKDTASYRAVVSPEAKIEKVQIGAVTGKYVEGNWRGTDCCGWEWVPEPYFKILRWWADGRAFELKYFGMDLEKADMIKIAESLK